MPTAKLPITQTAGIPSGFPTLTETPYWPIGWEHNNYYSPGGDAILLSYVTQIWQYNVLGPGVGFGSEWLSIPRIGSYNQLFGLLQFEMVAALIRIDEIPDQIDTIFGTPPLLSCGVAGFAWAPEVAPTLKQSGTLVDGTYKLEITYDGDFRGPWDYVNQQRGVFFPPSRGCTDFWWHLKEGIRASVRVFGARPLLRPTITLTDCAIPFDPLGGGGCTKYTQDECVRTPDGYGCEPPTELP